LDQKAFTTRAADVATWLVFRRHWCRVVIDDQHRPVFVFDDVPALHADVEAFPTATASASGLVRAGNVVRKLARRAALRHREWEQSVAARAAANAPTRTPGMFERMAEQIQQAPR
jgi:hypothetical protein